MKALPISSFPKTIVNHRCWLVEASSSWSRPNHPLTLSNHAYQMSGDGNFSNLPLPADPVVYVVHNSPDCFYRVGSGCQSLLMHADFNELWPSLIAREGKGSQLISVNKSVITGFNVEAGTKTKKQKRISTDVRQGD